MTNRTMDVSTYLDQLSSFLREEGPDVYLPLPIAAAILGVTPAAVRSQIKRRQLEAFDLVDDGARWPGVSARRLVAMLEDRKQVSADVALRVERILQELGAKIITYGELMDRVGLSWRNPHHRALIGRVLEIVSSNSYDKEDRILRSAIVVNKQTGLPSDSFFDLAKRKTVMRAGTDPKQFWERHIEKIRQRSTTKAGMK